MSKKGIDQRIFWSHVRKQEDGCWIWTGPNSKPSPTAAVYGKYTYRGVSHRIAYELLVGPIPEGLELDHLCRVTLCCNPDHLEPVTRAENVRRRYRDTPPATHCAKGHEYEDPYAFKCGRRCRECERKYKRDWMRAKYHADKERRALAGERS